MSATTETAVNGKPATVKSASKKPKAVAKKSKNKKTKAAKVSEPNFSLRLPQIRILKALSSADDAGLTRPEIAKKAKVSLSMTANVGPYSADEVAACDAHYRKRSLLSFGYVYVGPADEEDPTHVQRYYISAKGRRALESLKAKK